MTNPRPSRRGQLTGLAFASPWLVGLALLVLFPFAASLFLSFTAYDMHGPPQPVGWRNYERLAVELRAGNGFGQALFNTAYYAAVSVPLSIGLGVGLAVMLSWHVPGRSIFRALVFLPSVVPVVASAILWMWLLDPRDGIVNYLLGLIGIPPPLWFKGPDEGLLSLRFGSKDALVLMSLWGVGNYMLIYLAALNDIPQQLYEAAEIDGAPRWRRFWHITLPMLSPVIFFNLIMGLIQSVQAFTQAYIVSEGVGAPAGSTLMLSLHLFLSAFKDSQMGYASAMAWILFAVLLAATAGLFRSARNWVHYAGALR